MDFEFYRNFLTVAETGNITTAARKLAIAQPALTAQIKTLEQYYGAKLISTGRGKRRLELTEAGRAFFAKASQICAVEENITLDMLNFNKQAVGTLRFGVSPVKCSEFINKYLIPFAAAYPNIDYQFQAEAVTLQIAHIEDGTIDFAYANAPLPSVKGLGMHKARKEYFYAVYGKASGLALPPAISIDTLRELTLCCNYGYYNMLRQACRRHGFMPKVHFVANTSTAVLDFIRGSGDIAVITMDEDDSLPDGLAKARITEKDLYFEPALYWSVKTRLSSAAQQFLEFYEKRYEAERQK